LVQDIAMPLIRRYQAQDAPHVEQCFVELQAFEQQLEPNRVEGQAIATTYRHHLLNRCAQTEGAIFVAEDSATVIGFVAVFAHVDSESLIEAMTDHAYISDLVVLPAYRRRGVGRALLQAAETYARNHGATVLKVDVLVANTDAYNLYREFGFHDHEMRLTKALSQ